MSQHTFYNHNIKMLLILSLCLVAVASAVTIPEPLVFNGPEAAPFVDTETFWKSFSGSQRFNPGTDNAYHLFTRANPTVSQPIVQGLPHTLSQSNYVQWKRTVIVIHGMNGNAASHFNQVVSPALLRSSDVNVINVDWRIGAAQGNGDVIDNAIRSGQAVGNFINWLMSQTGQTANDFIIVGFSLGGLKSGVVGRTVQGSVASIIAIDLLHRPGSIVGGFQPSDGAYTEAIRTAVSTMGDLPAAQVDFYVNGGDNMPGCGNNFGCNHARAYMYYAESLVSGGFLGQRCGSLQDARAGTCALGGLRMGGLLPKTGASGIFYVPTNANSPFSRG